MVHIHNGILLGHEKEWNNATCSNTGRPRNCHTERSVSDGENKYHDIAHMWNLKKKELIYKTERVTDRENKLMVTRGGRGDKLEDWHWHTHTTIYKIDNK